MANFVKIGAFSDGGHRIRIVKQGYNADPMPADSTAVIFDSDWPDIFQTQSGFFGLLNVPAQNSSGTVNTSVTQNFPYGLSYTPTFSKAYSASSAQSDSVTSVGYLQTLDHDTYDTFTGSTASYVNLINGGYITHGLITGNANSCSSITLSSPPGNNLWAAFLNDVTIVAGNEGARAGAGVYMKITSAGPVITKPGRNINSTNYLDFLIPPAGIGPVLFQPVVSGTASSLPWVGNYTLHIDQGVGVNPRYINSVYGVYGITVPHNLGYVPIFASTTYNDFRNLSQAQGALLAADTNNLYIFVIQGAQGAAGNNLAINSLSYFALPQRWV